jgi:hypothetical protein
MKTKYTKTKLLKLLETSPAYAALSPQKKADINFHLQQNNVSVLQYVYYILLEESQVNQELRAELAEKIIKIGEKTTASIVPEFKKALSLA